MILYAFGSSTAYEGDSIYAVFQCRGEALEYANKEISMGFADEYWIMPFTVGEKLYNMWEERTVLKWVETQITIKKFVPVFTLSP